MTTTTTTSFTLKEKSLILESGKTVSFPYPISKALGFDDAIVVMLDVPQGVQLNENVFGISYEGETLWQVERRQYISKHSSYTGLGRRDDNAFLSNWDGLELTVNPATGEVLQQGFGR